MLSTTLPALIALWLGCVPAFAATFGEPGGPEGLSNRDWNALKQAHARALLPDDGVRQRAYLKASNTDLGDLLGWSVAVSGDTVVVSAIGEDSQADGANGDHEDNSAPSSGAVYVYVREGDGWVQEAYLKASNSDSVDQFGLSISIDGDTLVAGARLEASAATGVNGNEADNTLFRAGAAYVFVRESGAWTQQAYLKASNTEAGDQFGYSVSVSGDTIVIGANGEDSASAGIDGNGDDNSLPSSGAAYVFERVGTAWNQVAYLKASNPDAGDEFGDAVAIDGDTIAIGARTESSAAGDPADNSVPGSGAVYVFHREAGTWSQEAVLKAANAGNHDWFGFSVSVSGDSILVGAIGEDSSSRWIDGEDNDDALGAGAAYVFVRESVGSWTQEAYLKAWNADVNDAFARRVSISGDLLVVGAHNEDSASMGVGGDPEDDSSFNSGAAYVFERVQGVWFKRSYLKPSNTGVDDNFGWWVAVSGSTVVVGAYLEDSPSVGIDGIQDDDHDAASAAGAAFVFDVDAFEVEGSGCPATTSPRVDPRAQSYEPFAIGCGGFSCSGSTTMLMFGSCAPTSVDLLPPLGCGVCGFAILDGWGSSMADLQVGTGLDVGFEFCVQCGCFDVPEDGPGCVKLSPGVRVVVRH